MMVITPKHVGAVFNVNFNTHFKATDIWVRVLFRNLSRKLKIHQNLTGIKGILHEDRAG
jgi:hypothetical protein